ncbi:MAG: hypothetical protein E6Q33_03170, partial [Neisseriales bacterium]
TPGSQSFLFHTTAVIIGIPNKSYNNTLYYKISEEEKNSNFIIDVAIDKQYNNFNFNDKVKIVGQFYLDYFYDKIQLKIKAESMLLLELETITTEKPIDTLDEIKQIQPKHTLFPFTESLIRMAIILPKDPNSESRSDFILKIDHPKYKNILEYKEYNCAINNKSDLLKTLSELSNSNYHIIAIIRGGGSLDDLSVFDDLEICRLFSKFNSHKIIGIGHAKNRNLLEFAADHVSNTPTDLGNYLCKCLDLKLSKEENNNLNRLNQELKAQNNIAENKIIDLAAQLESNSKSTNNNQLDNSKEIQIHKQKIINLENDLKSERTRSNNLKEEINQKEIENSNLLQTISNLQNSETEIKTNQKYNFYPILFAVITFQVFIIIYLALK